MTPGARVPPLLIASRDNALLKQLRRLGEHGSAYRKLGQFWIEGDHLCHCAIARGLRPAVLVMSESFASQVPPAWADAAARSVLLPDRLFASVSGLESAAGVGFLLDLPAAQAPLGGVPSVVLDRVQDAGNVGSILRSAAAFGFQQVLALHGTAALWSPKVLRAGMGAHFGLRLAEALDCDAVLRTGLPLVATSSHQGTELRQLVLPRPCAWIFGHEGQGVAADLLARADVLARIAQPGGEESLNVAAAAAICLYASAPVGAA